MFLEMEYTHSAITKHSSIQTVKEYDDGYSYLNLSLHGNTEEGDEIHDKNGPKHGNVEAIEERADHCNRC